jgi:hypothetical protein
MFHQKGLKNHGLSLLPQVKPAAIIDSAIQFFLDIVVPGRGAGENSW